MVGQREVLAAGTNATNSSVLLTSIPTYTSSSITLFLTAHPTRSCTCGLVPCARPCQLFELWTLELADATILAKPRSLPTQVLTVCRARHYLHTPICRYKVLTKHRIRTLGAAGSRVKSADTGRFLFSTRDAIGTGRGQRYQRRAACLRREEHCACLLEEGAGRRERKVSEDDRKPSWGT